MVTEIKREEEYSQELHPENTSPSPSSFARVGDQIWTDEKLHQVLMRYMERERRRKKRKRIAVHRQEQLHCQVIQIPTEQCPPLVEIKEESTTEFTNGRQWELSDADVDCDAVSDFTISECSDEEKSEIFMDTKEDFVDYRDDDDDDDLMKKSPKKKQKCVTAVTDADLDKEAMRHIERLGSDFCKAVCDEEDSIYRHNLNQIYRLRMRNTKQRSKWYPNREFVEHLDLSRFDNKRTFPATDKIPASLFTGQCGPFKSKASGLAILRRVFALLEFSGHLFQLMNTERKFLSFLRFPVVLDMIRSIANDHYEYSEDCRIEYFPSDTDDTLYLSSLVHRFRYILSSELVILLHRFGVVFPNEGETLELREEISRAKCTTPAGHAIRRLRFPEELTLQYTDPKTSHDPIRFIFIVQSCGDLSISLRRRMLVSNGFTPRQILDAEKEGMEDLDSLLMLLAEDDDADGDNPSAEQPVTPSSIKISRMVLTSVNRAQPRDDNDNPNVPAYPPSLHQHLMDDLHISIFYNRPDKASSAPRINASFRSHTATLSWFLRHCTLYKRK